MNTFPPSFLKVAQSAAKVEDADSAISQAVKRVRTLPDFDGFVDQLLREAIGDLIYKLRHEAAKKRRAEQDDKTEAKPPPARGRSSTHERNAPPVSKIVNDVYQSVYDYEIAGKALGALYGRDLEALVASESMLAAGHTFNARLCAMLADRVPKDKRVKDAITDKELKQKFDQLYESVVLG